MFNNFEPIKYMSPPDNVDDLVNTIRHFVNNDNLETSHDQLAQVLYYIVRYFNNIPPSGLSSVITDLTLTGQGTNLLPLGLADNVVTTAKLVDAAVTFAKIAQNGATSGQVIQWNGVQWVAGTPTSGGSDVYFYDAGDDAYVTATAPGITFSKNSGLGTFVIPNNVKLLSCRIHGTNSELNANNFSIIFSNQFGNSSLAELFVPVSIMKYDRIAGNAPSEGTPYIYDIDNNPQVQITGVNPLRIRVINLNVYLNWGLCLNF